MVSSGDTFTFSRHISPAAVRVSTLGANRLVQGTVGASVISSSVGTVSTVSAITVGGVVSFLALSFLGSRNLTTRMPVASSTSAINTTSTTTRPVLSCRDSSAAG